MTSICRPKQISVTQDTLREGSLASGSLKNVFLMFFIISLMYLSIIIYVPYTSYVVGHSPRGGSVPTLYVDGLVCLPYPL